MARRPFSTSSAWRPITRSRPGATTRKARAPDRRQAQGDRAELPGGGGDAARPRRPARARTPGTGRRTPSPSCRPSSARPGRPGPRGTAASRTAFRSRPSWSMVAGPPAFWSPAALAAAVAALVPVDGPHRAAQGGALEVPGVLVQAVAVREHHGHRRPRGGLGVGPAAAQPAALGRPRGRLGFGRRGLVGLVVQLRAVLGAAPCPASRAGCRRGPSRPARSAPSGAPRARPWPVRSPRRPRRPRPPRRSPPRPARPAPTARRQPRSAPSGRGGVPARTVEVMRAPLRRRAGRAGRSG